jgi:predicted nucleic acid-binding protein
MVGKPLVYLDTSGVLAFLDSGDAHHKQAIKAWQIALERQTNLVLTDYVRLECWSLLQRRLGLAAVEDFMGEILPLCRVEVVGENNFMLLARQALLMQRKKLSLVDLSSFDCMQRLGVRRALAFDKHFVEQGYLTPTSADW